MKSLPQLLLYSTDHCTLCETALDALLSMPELTGLALRVVDIADDEALVERYGEILPVLCIEGEDAELRWPFDAQGVARWLRETL